MPKRILIVEDDLLNRRLFGAVLESAEFDVRTEGNGANVIAVARDFRPDLITMDINLPNVSGMQLIDILQADAQLKKIPIIAITAYVGKGEETEIMDAGASGYLAKPISVGPLLAAVAKLLDPATKPGARPLRSRARNKPARRYALLPE